MSKEICSGGPPGGYLKFTIKQSHLDTNTPKLTCKTFSTARRLMLALLVRALIKNTSDNVAKSRELLYFRWGHWMAGSTSFLATAAVNIMY